MESVATRAGREVRKERFDFNEVRGPTNLAETDYKLFLLLCPSVRKGRLKAIDEYGNFRGYITAPADEHLGLYERTSKSPDDALLVSFIVSSVDEPFELQIIVSLAAVLFSLPTPFSSSFFPPLGSGYLSISTGW